MGEVFLPQVTYGIHLWVWQVLQTSPMQSNLMVAIEFVRAYLDDLLCITMASLDDHLDHLRLVLPRLQEAGLKSMPRNLNSVLRKLNI